MTTIPKNNAAAVCKRAVAAERDLYLQDEVMPGLFLRVTPQGHKTWQLRYRTKLETRWATRRAPIGAFPAVTVSAARAAAHALTQAVRNGDDPAAPQAGQFHRELSKARRMSVNALFEYWAQTDLIRRADHGAEARRMMGKDVLPYIGLLPVGEVRKFHITQVTDAILARDVKRMAKVVFSLMRQMFGFAVDRDIIDADPTAGIRKAAIGGPEVTRERVLNDAEVAELARKLPASGLSATSTAAVWLLLSTCCRVGELLAARWEEVNFAERLWYIPAERTKNRRAHTVQLSDFALQQFQELHGITGQSEWCYPARNVEGPVSSKVVTKQVRDRQRIGGAMGARTKLTTALMLPGGIWKPHDLRRTAATLMVKHGALPDVVERCLNHLEPNKVKRVYQQHSFEREQGEAWELLGERLTALVSSPTPSQH